MERNSGRATEGAMDRAEQLSRLEGVIQKGVDTFAEVGAALGTIREQKLWKENGYHSFDDYLRRRWDFGRRYANHLIGAAGVMKQLAAIGDDESNRRNHGSRNGSGGESVALPNSERQVRPLRRLAESDRRGAWEEAVRRSPDGNPTASTVERVVAERLESRTETAVDAPDESGDSERAGVKDCAGRWVDDPLFVSAMEKAEALIEFRNEAKRLRDRLLEIAGKPGPGAFLTTVALESAFDDILGDLKLAKPGSVCPYCVGDAEGCSACNEQGWVPKAVHDLAPASLKQMLDEKFGEAEGNG